MKRAWLLSAIALSACSSSNDDQKSPDTDPSADACATTCTPGAWSCTTPTARAACDSTGCGFGALELCACGCEDGACRNSTCQPNVWTCTSSEARVQCDSAGCAATNREECACGCSGGECGAGTPGTCAAGATTCTSSIALRTCDAWGCSATSADCACGCSNGACSSGTPGTCVANVWTCVNQNMLARCDAFGCGAAETRPCECGCDDNLECRRAACTPGRISCARSSNAIERCSADGCMLELVPCPNGCSAGACSP